MNKIGYKISLLLIAMLCINACERPPESKTKEQVMQERLDGRLEKWESSLMARCRKEVLEAATAIVDSTLLVDARLKRDVSDLPNMPGRPNRPGFDAPEDTTPIAPLLKFIQDSLLQDSLLQDSLQIDSFLIDSLR